VDTLVDGRVSICFDKNVSEAIQLRKVVVVFEGAPLKLEDRPRLGGYLRERKCHTLWGS
jgi:hypothetical protein